MKAKHRSLPSAVTTRAVAPTTVTVLYDDLSACLRAGAFLDCALSPIGSTQALNFMFCDCDHLPECTRKFRDVSRDDPTAIVVLVARRRSLSTAVERWIAGWLQTRHEHPSALVLLLEKRIASARDDAAVLRLRQEAGENGVDFLCEFSQPETRLADIRTEQRLYHEPVIRWAMKDIIEEAVAPHLSGINR